MSETAPSTTARARPKDSRRVYYDHEPAYRKIEAKGGHGWDDLSSEQTEDSYVALRVFLQSPYAPSPGSAVNVLDLGCGGGQATILLAKRGWNAFGVDYASTAVRLARRNASAAGVTAHLLVGDCLSCPFAAEVMDLVLDNHVLHCLIGRKDRRAFLRSAYRVLKRGGVLFSETGSCEGVFGPEAVDADPVTRISRSWTRYWVGRSELNEEFTVAGFRILHQYFRGLGEASGAGANIVTYADTLPSLRSGGYPVKRGRSRRGVVEVTA